jgi:hypothetical protein
MKNILKIGIRSKSIHTAFLMAENQFPCSWIRIRISDTDLVPRQLNEGESRWIRIRIHNTDQDASCNTSVAARDPCGKKKNSISKDPMFRGIEMTGTRYLLF